MTLRQRLFDGDSDRAVSPVIGVILMVAITVILAAVIGTFVLGLTEKTGQTTPQVSASISDADEAYANDTAQAFSITHNGGEDLVRSSFEIRIRNASDNGIVAVWSDGTWYEGTELTTSMTKVTLDLNGGTFDSNEAFSSGDEIQISGGASTTSAHDLIDNTRYKITLVDTDSGRTITEATVRLK